MLFTAAVISKQRGVAMSKYGPLGDFLGESGEDRIPMSFKDLERVIGSALPNSKIYPAWWSNNDSNNPMTKVWLAAGYRTEQVDIEGCKLVFRKIEAEPPTGGGFAESASGQAAISRHPLIGCLKGLVTVAPGTDLTEPADPEWADMLDDPRLHQQSPRI